MNWLGHTIQKYVSKNDTVLDLGCGIMQATTDILNSKRRLISKPDILECKHLLGCDIWAEYLAKSKDYFPVVRLGMDELDRFPNESYDIVMALDVLEHLSLDLAMSVIDNMKRIARSKVIVYTPSVFHEQDTNSWGMGDNPYQQHKCFIEPKKLEEMGFKVTFPEPDGNTLGIYMKKF